MTRLLTLLAVLGLLLGACGDDDDTSAETDRVTPTETETDTETETAAEDDDEDEGAAPGTDDVSAEDATDEDYAAALAAELGGGGAFPGEPDQIECVAGVFVDSIGGADALRDAGVSPRDLADAEGPGDLGVELDEDQVADDLVGGFEECDYDLLALLTESLGPDAPEGFEECVRAEITNDDIAGVFARLIIDPTDEEAASSIVPQLEECAGPAPAG